jgi:hypothetical protein
MSTDLTYRQHVQNFDDLLNEVREAVQNDDFDAVAPLSIDDIITRRVWLTFGGPNVYIDFRLIDECSHYSCLSAMYVHVWGNDRVEYQLSEDEAQELFDAYGLEYKI